MNPAIPSTMQAVVLHSYSLDDWRVESRPIPTLKPSDILIKIAASPINPSDIAFMQGLYGIRKALPVVPGFEASGHVVAVGERLNADEWIGRRVACLSGAGDGTYAEYMATNAAFCFPLSTSISEEAASMILVNPLTVWALVEIALASGGRAIIQTAAAGALGQMLRRYGESRGLAVINVVHRPALVEKLQSAGAAHVLDSSTERFEDDLKALARSLDARLAFDAAGGPVTGRILRAMPNGSQVIVYGGLDGRPTEIGVDQLIFRDKQVGGFWLSTWLPKNPEKARRAWEEIQAQHAIFASTFRGRYGLHDFGEAVRVYTREMSGGKILITP